MPKWEWNYFQLGIQRMEGAGVWSRVMTFLQPHVPVLAIDELLSKNDEMI